MELERRLLNEIEGLQKGINQLHASTCKRVAEKKIAMIKWTLEMLESNPNITIQELADLMDYRTEMTERELDGAQTIKETEEIFKHLSIADDSLGVLSEFIIKEVEKATKNIHANYAKATEFQNTFIITMNHAKSKLREQADKMRSLKNDFNDLSGEFATKELVPS